MLCHNFSYNSGLIAMKMKIHGLRQATDIMMLPVLAIINQSINQTVMDTNTFWLFIFFSVAVIAVIKKCIIFILFRE